jgi:hypothetical protein
MKDFLKWFGTSKLASYLRSFVAIVVAQAVTEFQRIGQFDFTNLSSWVIAALVATLPVLLRILNPQDQLS